MPTNAVSKYVGMEVTKFLLHMLSGGYLLVAVKVASSIFANQLNSTKLKSSETQLQFQFELNLEQLSPSSAPACFLIFHKFLLINQSHFKQPVSF